MSGHSKWSTIKHKKGAADAKRGRLFTKLIKEITMSAKVGGGVVESNPRLRSAVLAAKKASMPSDNIDKAIKRGTGELEGVRYEPVTYEGYAPGGVAVIVETLTDNRNRTSAEIKHLFARNGGSIAEPGAVSWQFDRRGQITLAGPVDEDQLLEWVLESGGENFEVSGEEIVVTTEPQELARVREALEGYGLRVTGSELTLVPQNVIPVSEEGEARRVLRLVDAIDDHDDVQNVYANFDIADDVMSAFDE